MKKLWYLIPLLVVYLVACEPLAPDPQAAPVIVVTSTHTPAPPMSPTSPLSGAENRPPPPTLTPTETAVPNPTATMLPCDETEGRILTLEYESQIAGEAMPYYAYIPPCYGLSGRRYPYIILLHGAPASGYDYTHWPDVGIQEAMDEGIADPVDPLAPAIVIMPEGGYLQEENYFEAGLSFESLILAELIPEVENYFCTWGTREGRAIGGISRGGFWAFSIGFRHPDLFAAIGGHSPWFVADNAPPSHNPLNLANTINASTHLRIFLDNAQNDQGGPGVIQFYENLNNNGVNAEYTTSAVGGHNNAYWSSRIREYLEFYTRNWAKDAGLYPTCF